MDEEIETKNVTCYTPRTLQLANGRIKTQVSKKRKEKRERAGMVELGLHCLLVVLPIETQFP